MERITLKLTKAEYSLLDTSSKYILYSKKLQNPAEICDFTKVGGDNVAIYNADKFRKFLNDEIDAEIEKGRSQTDVPKEDLTNNAIVIFHCDVMKISRIQSILSKLDKEAK